MKRLLNFTEIISVVLLAGCTIMGFVNVVARYIFSRPIAWSDEMNVLALVWMVYLSQGILEAQNNQLRLTVLYNVMGRRLRYFVNGLRSLVTISLCCLFLYAGMGIVIRNYQLGIRTQALGFPIWIAYLALSVAFFLTALVRVLNPLIESRPELAGEKGENA
jgi:TRAP-type transport system small permease protein